MDEPHRLDRYDTSSSEHIISLIYKVPDAILRAELSRRSSTQRSNDDTTTCGSRERGAYNTPVHVFALFLILVLSTLACSFPVLARRFPRLPIPRRFLFLSRHFGTGVLIATAFVHLLPTAFVSLTDPCLPRFWSQTYRAMAGFVAMISVFVVVLVEMFFALKGAGHVHGSEYDQLIGDVGADSASDDQDEEINFRDGVGEDIHLDSIEEHTPSQPSGPLERTSAGECSRPKNTDLAVSTEGRDMEYGESDPYESASINIQKGRRDQSWRSGGHRSHAAVHQGTDIDSSRQNPQRLLLQCLLLEAGILFHSIFIGMALSVATGTPFIVLLVAICFHQTFEGFALGSRIASLIPDLFPPSSFRPWLMALAYGTTTPIGQAMGLLLHNLYDPTSTTGLLMVGITNAISSGLLLFAGLVELLAEDFLSETSYATLRGQRRIEACMAVAGGALLMAFVGAFA
ncbi:Zinc/iron permease [Aspergillus sclerotioniger CBS 115572]|uniref:Zinc/iron permease n=1 Tax=Aspergillus sclerotioniger CBS 115572 TaxID=1450535 RepID=A0A317VDU2_9EURO|nr:Zinc/iron permease [Aspergillus sclerotioniger CBS 115572]PWY72543.1 Zinc/iron permease [Aspergillus sclerotioniger CBS 115572]